MGSTQDKPKPTPKPSKWATKKQVAEEVRQRKAARPRKTRQSGDRELAKKKRAERILDLRAMLAAKTYLPNLTPIDLAKEWELSPKYIEQMACEAAAVNRATMDPDPDLRAYAMETLRAATAMAAIKGQPQVMVNAALGVFGLTDKLEEADLRRQRLEAEIAALKRQAEVGGRGVTIAVNYADGIGPADAVDLAPADEGAAEARAAVDADDEPEESDP